MKTMKYPNIPQTTNMSVNNGGSHVEEVDSLFTSPCWQNSSIPTEFIHEHKLILDTPITNLGSDKLLLGSPIHEDSEMESKVSMETLDSLLLNTGQGIGGNLAELKPLPPFTAYSSNLSINGIQGHHYNTISQRGIQEENNNNYTNYNEQNIVSSSTCNVEPKTFFPMEDSISKYEDSAQVKTESEYDISSIEDIAAIIGSAMIPDTTDNQVHQNQEDNHHQDSRDSWMDLDAWIDGACVEQKGLIISQEGLSEFVIPNQSVAQQQAQQQPQSSGSTLQTLLTYGIPINRPKLEVSSSNVNTDFITSSPPSVVSTTDNLLVTSNGRFLQYNIHNSIEEHSAELLGQNFPHTTTTSTPTRKKRTTKKSTSSTGNGGGSAGSATSQPCSSTVFPTSDQTTLGVLGREKPVHRCSVCNRGFLNKSNIKVHLRTHTGEKPFRCDTCAKAFRQKAHLLKHQQIHKRIGRD